jgi:hypothetical protein
MATYDTLQVDIGNAPNDNQGDPLRQAFDKINQRFQELRIFVSNRGDWMPNTAYTADPNRDWVIVDGVGYLATINHVSGATFAADLAAGKWVDADSVNALVAAQDAQADVDALRADLASTTSGNGAELVGFKQAGTGAVDRTALSKMRERVSVFDFMTPAQIADVQSGAGEMNVTAAIQAAIDAVHTSGGGEVFMPEGTYSVGATASPETWQAYAAGGTIETLGPAACCLILRDRVYLRGAGINATLIVLPLSTNVDGVYVTNSPNGYGIKDLTIDGRWNEIAELNSHGVFWVTSIITGEASTVFSNGEILNVGVRRFSSYGFGIEYGVFKNNLFDNIYIQKTGADGIDVKNRHSNRGNRISNATISEFGLRASLLSQAGIDLRGEGWSIISPRITDYGRSDTEHAAIRFRENSTGVDTNGAGASKSFVQDFVIQATNTNTRGIESYGSACTIGPGDISGCSLGVWIKGLNENVAATDNLIFGVTVDGNGSSGNAFASEGPFVLRTRWVGCTAKNISQGWRPAGSDDQIIGCAVGSGVAFPLLLTGNPTRLTITSSPSLTFEQKAPSFLSEGPITIANNAVVFVPTGNSSFYRFGLISTASAGAAQPLNLFGFRPSSSPQCTSIVTIAATTNVLFTTGVLTGTTGGVGNFTVSAVEGGLYIENRGGSSRTVHLTFFGPR